MIIDYDVAKNKMLEGDYSVTDYFRQNNYILEYAYCKFLSGDLNSAKTEFSRIKNKDMRADWALKIIQIIENDVKETPSYFQIRNFLEIDLNLLLQAGKADYIEEIINCADLFYSVNPECYKFIARVMINNDFTDVAVFYLNEAKNKFYKDPEMHYMFAICYLKNQELELAKSSLQTCLSILPQYTPAKKLLEKISK